MTEDAVIHVSSARVRAISFALSAVLVFLAVLALFVVSRVVTLIEPAPIAVVEVEIIERQTPRRAPPRLHTPPPSGAASNAPAAVTDIPIDRAMLARTLNCFQVRRGQPRPPDCPALTPGEIEAAGGNFPTDRQRELLANPPQNSAQVFAGIPPPCPAGLSSAPGMAGVQFCARGGLVPQESARSAEVICESGGIGPCRPPAFRPEDVVRLRHTQ
jgi:hypothetical protein